MTLAKKTQNPAPSIGTLVPDETDLHETSWRAWLLLLILALLLHAFVFVSHVPWSGISAPPRVDLQEVTPKQLDQIRKSWRKIQPKGLLIDRDKSKPSEKEAPENARYMSDRNIRVEKEQRARSELTRPEVGGSQNAHPSVAHPPSLPRQATPPRAHFREMPKLGDLGVPLRLTAKTPEEAARESREEERSRMPSGPPGGQQWLDDKNLPEGSENMLNAAESVYYSFYSRIYDQLAPIWSSMVQEAGMRTNPRPGDYDTQVDVVLDGQGNLIETRIMQASGVTEIDRAATDAFRRISRFPNPPAGLLDAAGQLHMSWSFRYTAIAGGIQFAPPERVY